MSQVATPGPLLLDALSLLSEVADDLVVKTVRDTHLAALDRVATVTRGTNPLHRGIAGAVYGCDEPRAARGLPRPRPGRGHRSRAAARGRRARPVRQLGGQRADRRQAARERPQLAIPMAVRVRGARRRRRRRTALAAAYPQATGQLVFFLHGLCENESYFRRDRERTGTTYAEMLEGLGWTPLMLRANTGLPLRENGAALTALVQRVVDGWPVPVTRIALVGHSLGGLVIRAAGAVADEVDEPWRDRVTDVITLGTPHLGAPIAWGIGHGSRGLGRLPETAAFGRILDWRSQGVHDLVAGLAEDVPPLPHARYHLVAATADRLAAAPGRRRGRRPAGAAALGVRPRPARARAVPRRRRAARGPDRPLRPAQPPRGARRDEALAGRMTRSRHGPDGSSAADSGDRSRSARAPSREHHRRAAGQGLGADHRRLAGCRTGVPSWSGCCRSSLAGCGAGSGTSASTGARPWSGRPATSSASSSPAAALAWDTTSSGARWIWELSRSGEGTHVVHRRPVPEKLTLASGLFARFLLGGVGRPRRRAGGRDGPHRRAAQGRRRGLSGLPRADTPGEIRCPRTAATPRGSGHSSG